MNGLLILGDVSKEETGSHPSYFMNVLFLVLVMFPKRQSIQ